MSSLGIFDKKTKTYKKVAGTAEAAVVDNALSPTSTNPVQNKVVTSHLNDIRKETIVNLLNATLGTVAANGITCTNNGDGTYTFNGTATDSVFFNINKNIVINKGTKYKVVCFKDEDYIPNKITSCVRRVDTTDEYVFGNGSFTADTENCWLWIQITKNTTVSNLVAKPMLTTNLAATYDDFVPYTGDTGRLNSDVAALQAEVANNRITVDAAMSDTSTNPVQNKVINTKLNSKANVFKYDFIEQNVYKCLGTATLRQEGGYLILHIYCGEGYNARIAQDRAIDVHIRASNNYALDGKYYAGYIESHLNGANNCNVYVVQNSSTSFTIWIGKLTFSGRSFYEVQLPNGDSWVPSTNTSPTIPTNGVALIEKEIAYTDLATTSTNGLMSYDMVSKLNRVEEGANKTIVDAAMSDTSTNPVQNKVVTSNLNDIRKETTVNLLNPTLETTIIDGITCTNNGDGTYTLNGTVSTPSNRAVIVIQYCGDMIKKHLNEELLLIGCPKHDESIDAVLHLDAGPHHAADSDGNGHIFKFSQVAGSVPIKIEIGHNGTTVNNLVFKPMITTNLNATYDDFVPYTGDTGKLNSDVAGLFKRVTFERNNSVFPGGGLFLTGDTAGRFSSINRGWSYIEGNVIEFTNTKDTTTNCSVWVTIPAHSVGLFEAYSSNGASVEVKSPLFFYNDSDSVQRKTIVCYVTAPIGTKVSIAFNPIVIKNV